MRIKLLVVLCLSAFLFLAGCRGDSNANVNANKAATATPTPVTKTTESATVDPNLKAKIESALKAKGFNDVTVDTSTTPMTISGTVAKGKMDQVMATVQENNGGKPVTNKVTEK
jgi:PBP1b-binding outer membrane lipoprotein LpoB